jgi:hypothetical protein
MRKIFYLFLFSLVLLSCTNGSPDTKFNETHLLCEKLFSEITDTNATLCISNGEFHIYAQFQSSLSSGEDLVTGRYDHFFHLYADDSIVADPVKDSLTTVEFQTDFQDRKFNCYDTLGNFDFQYDSNLPMSINLKSGEMIEHTLVSNDLFVFTIANSQTWETDMILALRGDTVRTTIGHPGENVDLFFYDFKAGSLPEIFVVTHFRMPSTVVGETPMIRLEIYQLHFD